MKKTYLIGNAHIDPVWLWRWQEGFSEIRATFRSALDRMNDYPDFRFTSACAVYYEWIEKVDPEMFAEIRQRVKEGRWETTFHSEYSTSLISRWTARSRSGWLCL